MHGDFNDHLSYDEEMEFRSMVNHPNYFRNCDCDLCVSRRRRRRIILHRCLAEAFCWGAVIAIAALAIGGTYLLHWLSRYF